MTTHEHEHDEDVRKLLYWPIDEVRADVACPQCGHSLRGLKKLPGVRENKVVACPECGHRCDVTELLRLHSVELGRRTPYVSLVMSPASVALAAAVCIGLYVLAMHLFNKPPAGWLWMSAGAGVLWLVAMLNVRVQFGSNRGLAVAAMAHGFMLLLTAAVLGGLATAGWLWILFSQGNLISAQTLAAAAGLAASLGLLWPTYRCHRAIRQACIDHFLRQAALRM